LVRQKRDLNGYVSRAGYAAYARLSTRRPPLASFLLEKLPLFRPIPLADEGPRGQQTRLASVARRALQIAPQKTTGNLEPRDSVGRWH